jgi:hypothetical protein
MKRIAILAAVAVFAVVPAALAASSGPTGTWKTNIPKSVLRGDVKGTWTIDFASGKYTVTWNGKTVLHGVYTVAGADINLTDKSGEVKCPGTGKYSYKVKGSKLTFKKIKDTSACVGRTDVLTTSPLTKVS